MQVDVGTETYDAFADVDFANVFLAADVSRAVLWAARDDDAKGRGLVSASRMLQRMPWAVDPVPAPADADVPEVLREVTAQLAADLLAKPRLFSDASTNSNIKSVKAGSANVEFFSPIRGGPPLPRALWDTLVAAGLVGLVEGEQTGTPYFSGGSACRPLGGRCANDWPIAAVDYD